MYKMQGMDKKILAVLVTSLVLAACGGGDDNNSSPATATSASASSAAASSAGAGSTSGSTTSSGVISSSYLDSNGWYWFNSANDAHTLAYLVGETLSSGTKYSLNGSATANAGEFIYAYANTIAATPANPSYDSTLLGSTYTGEITIPKASAAGGSDGGTLVFHLPSLSALSIFTYTTGSLYYAVDVSTDSGVTWTNKYSSGSTAVRSKGESTEDIGAKVGTTTSPIWVRIDNLGTGGININGILVK